MNRNVRSVRTNKAGRSNKKGRFFKNSRVRTNHAVGQTTNGPMAAPNSTPENDLLSTILKEMTSDADEFPYSDTDSTRIDKPLSIPIGSNPVETASSSSHLGSNQTIGEYRRQMITKQVKEFYQNICEPDDVPDDESAEDSWTNPEKRKDYATKIWFELKSYFNDVNVKDENALETNRRLIDKQRKKMLDEFHHEFHRTDFENMFHPQKMLIQRQHICESHLTNCDVVQRRILCLFDQWDAVLSLFPSHAALEQYDKRFDSRTKEGLIFYEKLFIIQAWFNLYTEVNQLISILGSLMSCSYCSSWPNHSHHGTNRSQDNLSRPQTPSSTSSNELKSRSSSFIQTPDHQGRRIQTIPSMSSIDSLCHSSSSNMTLNDCYYRYVDDQVTHARIELVARIFRSKHGPLLQRLRYIYQKRQRSIPSIFDSLSESSPVMLTNLIPNDYLIDAKPDRLVDEFFSLSKQLNNVKNPTLATQKKIKPLTRYGKANNILNRFDQNPTLTSSTFPSVSAPNLVAKILGNDRSVLKRQAYFLDYLDPTCFPHLPGSTLFPDPCTFLDQGPFDPSSQSTTDQYHLIAKMLLICDRLYGKHVWSENGRFVDMFGIFHLPSLYPQFVFLVQIPLDLMLNWHQYHQEKRMQQTSSKSALLLLIDECKILIHSATLIRQYVKLMMTETFEKHELQMIQQNLIQLDCNIIESLQEIISYIERFVEISLSSNLFHTCIILLREQWKSLKKYSALMNMDEFLGVKFLYMYTNIIRHFREYLDIFHSTTAINELNQVEQIRKKIHRKYQKRMTMDILRETKAIYDDCALAINIQSQQPVDKRFLLILKTAGFRRIQLGSEHVQRDHENGSKMKEETIRSKCVLFAPEEYFEDQNSRIQLTRTLSSSYRLHSNSLIVTDPIEDPFQSAVPSSIQQNSVNVLDSSPSSVCVLCVPISNELDAEWTGKIEYFTDRKNSSSPVPINSHWKTTNIFLLTQQTSQLKKFSKSFSERLSKINVQHSDSNYGQKTIDSILQRRSCFEKVDQAMHELAHEILRLSQTVISSIEQFENLLKKTSTIPHVHTEERVFAFAMDVIRETSFYATQFDSDLCQSYPGLQLSFASIWLNFVQKKKSTINSKTLTTSQMWLQPGIHFLRHACELHFTRRVDDQTFSKFLQNYQKTMTNMNNRYETNSTFVSPFRPNNYRLLSSSSREETNTNQTTKKKLTTIEKLEKLDRKIDRRRAKGGLIGFIQHDNKVSMISQKMEEDLASLKIREFRRMNLLACGQYATTYKCTAKIRNKQEILCYKQYKIQHNDARAIGKILEQLMPLMHINHENLIKYHGIALECDHILFFMEYCNYGTIAQLLLASSSPSGTNSSSDNVRATNSSNHFSGELSVINKSIKQTTAGYAYFEESLVQRYLPQLLSALTRLHGEKIIHRDIRNVNIFFTDSSKETIKLGDVNFVYDYKFMDHQSTSVDMDFVLNNRESIVFYAPETINRNETTTKSDIWSLGCTLLHMLTGRIPWTNQRTASSIYYFRVIASLANDIQPSISADLRLSEKCIDFLQKCFQYDANQRPSSEDLLQHVFVTGE